MGSALALRCAQSGVKASIVTRGQRLAELRKIGLRYRTNDSIEAATIDAVEWAEVDGPINLVIICTKTYDLAEVLSLMRGNVDAGTKILTLQNGVEAHESVSNCYPEAFSIPARVHGFFQLSEGVLDHIGVPATLLIGHRNPGEINDVRRVGAMLRSAGIDCVVSPDIERDLWMKFMLAASLGSVGAAFELAAGRVLAHPEARTLLRAALSEVAGLAKTRGIALLDDCVEQTIDFIRTFPIDATTSLQRDIQRGDKSEYAALPGAVLRLARRCSFSTPIFSHLDSEIEKRFPGATRASPPIQNLQDFD